MAQSTTNLGKIHVFPSETLYNQFKDIIADNDLALLKDDGAYIVAALLEQNGYVKFSNGLILQWGLTTSASEVVTYPIAVSQVYCLLLTTKATTFRYSPWPTAITTKSFQAVSDSEPAYWLLVAKQQWGLYDFSGSNGDKVYFPVAFTVMCAAAIVQPAGRNSHEVTNRTTTYIQGDFKYGDAHKLGTWIAVGY